VLVDPGPFHLGPASLRAATTPFMEVFDTALNSVRKSRQAKAQMFMSERHAFMAEMVAGI
jgi:hypothetical protein